MYVLGIETSCDETAAAVVQDGFRIRSSVVSSSLDLHKRYGGIVPEIAFRRQLETITGVADCCLRQARLALKDIGLISVTEEPGLLGSLLVGTSFAKTLGFCTRIPCVGVNHLHSHIYSGFLERRTVGFPFVSLVVSGGHTSLYEVKDFSRISLLGATCDDACGEAFDKVAKILGLGYPGGPVIEKLARSGNPGAIRFRCSNTQRPLDFSFSGIKTAVLYYVQKNFKPSPAARRPSHGRQRKSGVPGDRNKGIKVEDVCASFQEAALGVLSEKAFHACRIKRAKTLVVGGGVAANFRLRQIFERQALLDGIEVIFPKKELCMDNAAMVAGLGYRVYRKRPSLRRHV